MHESVSHHDREFIDLYCGKHRSLLLSSNAKRTFTEFFQRMVPIRVNGRRIQRRLRLNILWYATLSDHRHV